MAADCHFHVIGPHARFPMHPARGYTPAPASLLDWQAVMAPLGIDRGVLVQPSIYGTDNSALLSALAQGGGRLVGVAAVEAGVGEAGLDALAEAGIRGLRFAHFEVGDRRMLPGFVPLADLLSLAPRLKARGLHVDLFTDTRLLGGIAPLLRSAGVPVVLNHMGRTPSALGIAHGGMTALAQGLDEGWCWVKLSGLSNVSSQSPGFEDARPMHEWLLGQAPHRLVWGSDWPHTRPNGKAPITRSLVDTFAAWTPSDDRECILVTNAHTLYRFPI